MKSFIAAAASTSSRWGELDASHNIGAAFARSGDPKYVNNPLNTYRGDYSRARSGNSGYGSYRYYEYGMLPYLLRAKEAVARGELKPETSAPPKPAR